MKRNGAQRLARRRRTIRRNSDDAILQAGFNAAYYGAGAVRMIYTPEGVKVENFNPERYRK